MRKQKLRVKKMVKTSAVACAVTDEIATKHDRFIDIFKQKMKYRSIKRLFSLHFIKFINFYFARLLKSSECKRFRIKKKMR